MVRQFRAVLTALLLLAVGFGQGVSAVAGLHSDGVHSAASHWAGESGVASNQHHSSHGVAKSVADSGNSAADTTPDQSPDEPGHSKSCFAGAHCCASLACLAPTLIAAAVPPFSVQRLAIRGTSVAPDNLTYPLLRPPRRHA